MGAKRGKYKPRIKQQIVHIREVLSFGHICKGCKERINKAIDDYCHHCNGAHDIHIVPQAVSLLHKHQAR